MNNTSRETLSYINLCMNVCPYIYLLKFSMNYLFSCCFEITITPGGKQFTCGQPQSRCGQLARSAAGCVIFLPMDWWSRIVNTDPSGTVHRKYTGLPRRTDRNENYFALLYIVRQVTIPYSALQFRRNSPVFWYFEIPCQDIKYRVAHACGSRCTGAGVVNTGHRCDSQKISVFRCEYYRLQYRLSI